jgi:hypothetical protein
MMGDCPRDPGKPIGINPGWFAGDIFALRIERCGFLTWPY